MRLNPKLAEANLKEKIATRDGLKASLNLLKTLPRPEEQRAYQLAIDDAKVALQKAESLVERLRPLRERGDIPQQQLLFEAELAAEQASIAKQKAESQFAAAMLGPRREAVEEAEARIVAAEAGVAAAQKKQCELLELRSPIAGVIDRVGCKLGQTLAVAAPVADVVAADKFETQIWLPAADASRVQVGQAAEIPRGRRFRRGKGGRSRHRQGDVRQPHRRSADRQPFGADTRSTTKRTASRGGNRIGGDRGAEKPDALAVPAAALDDLGEDDLRLNVVRKGKSAVLHLRVGMKTKEWVEVQDTDL